MIKNNPLINTLLHLKGNPKACVYTEPLWGIPYNLFAPFVSVYMYALGLSDGQIGLVASISMAFQIVFSLLSGIITDKLGRRRTTFIFDLFAWTIPCLIWAFSDSFIHFVIAAIIGSTTRITMNSWSCLLVEDTDKEQIVNIYAWIYISGLGAAFFAPLSGLFIGRFDLIPTVRVIYMIACVMMTAKILLTYKYSTETVQGKIRMEETRHLNILQQLSGYRSVIKQMLKSPETMLALGIMLIMSICTMVNNTFWSILVTQKIGIPAESVGVFSFVRSFVMLVLFFGLIPKINALKFKKPLVTGFSTFIACQLLLIFTPEKGYLILIISIFLEACSLSLINPLLDSLLVIMVDPKERARIIAVIYVIIIALSSPFGWIAGILSGVDQRIPFTLNIILFTVGILLVTFTSIAASTVSKKAAVQID